MRMERATRLVAGSLIAVLTLIAAGCVSTVPQVQLQKKGTSYPVVGNAGSTWTHAQRRVIKAYRSTQLALVAASDSRSATQAETLLARHVLATDIPVFIAGMTVNWQRGDISSGKLDYQVVGVTFKHATALVETCWSPIAFAAKSAATGKLSHPLPKRSRHSITLMGLVKGHWLQGKSVAAPGPCD
jgi:hypothetical protein